MADKRWDPWRLSDDGAVLEREWNSPLHHYWVDLHRCTTPAEVLDTIFHASRASWADDQALAGLIRALDDVLDPMANLCSGGKPKTISSTKLKQLLDHATAR